MSSPWATAHCNILTLFSLKGFETSGTLGPVLNGVGAMRGCHQPSEYVHAPVMSHGQNSTMGRAELRGNCQCPLFSLFPKTAHNNSSHFTSPSCLQISKYFIYMNEFSLKTPRWRKRILVPALQVGKLKCKKRERDPKS